VGCLQDTQAVQVSSRRRGPIVERGATPKTQSLKGNELGRVGKDLSPTPRQITREPPLMTPVPVGNGGDSCAGHLLQVLCNSLALRRTTVTAQGVCRHPGGPVRQFAHATVTQLNIAPAPIKTGGISLKEKEPHEVVTTNRPLETSGQRPDKPTSHGEPIQR
jgi:hypothetical protein